MKRALLLLALSGCVLDPGALARPCDPTGDGCEDELICVPHEGGGACLPDPDAPVCSRVETVQRNVVLSTRSDIEDFLPPGFEGCLNLEGQLQISGAELEDLAGMEQLTEVSGDLSITENDLLRDLSGLDGLRVVGGVVSILENPSIEVAGFSALRRAGAFAWAGPAGEELQLKALRSVDGVLALSNLEGTSAVELEALTTAVELGVTFNESLERLDAPRLTSLTLLDAHDNPSLSSCALEALAAQSQAQADLRDNGPCEE